MEFRVGMSPQDAGRASGGDGAGEGLLDGICFELSGDSDDEVFSRHQGGAGEAESVGGDGVEVRKAAVVDLLLAAGFVELDDLDSLWIIEVGDGRIIESDVSIFTNSHADEVDGAFVHEFGVAGDLGVEISSFCSNTVEGFRGDFGKEVFFLIGSEGCWMGAAKADVFIHVEDGDFAPFDSGFLGKSGKGFIL